MTADFPSKKDSIDEKSNDEEIKREETQSLAIDSIGKTIKESSSAYPFAQGTLKSNNNDSEERTNSNSADSALKTEIDLEKPRSIENEKNEKIIEDNADYRTSVTIAETNKEYEEEYEEEKHLGAFLKSPGQSEQKELKTKNPADNISSKSAKLDAKELNGEDGQSSKADLSNKSKTKKSGIFSKKDKKEATLKQGIYAERAILAVPSYMPPSLSSRLFNLMSYLPWLFLTLLIVGQTIFSLDARSLWFSDEVRHAGAFTEMLSNGKIFALELNGTLYPDKPPLYFWFLYLLYDLIKVNGPLLYFSAAAISAVLYLWATLALGRFVARFDGKALLASGIILLTTSYLTGLMHYARMDFLFSSLILMSHVFFFVAWVKEKSKIQMILAFTFAALACLTKGPLGLAFPLATGLLFLVWQGKIKRLFRADFFIGLLVALFIVGGWLLGLYLETNLDYIKNEIFSGQVVQRALDARHHAQGWTYYLVRMPLLILPWLAVLFCLPYHRLFSKNTLNRIKASRTPEADGLSYLWCMMISGVLLLSLISTKILIYMLPVMPAMALLAGRAVLQMTGKRALAFRTLTCFLILIAGAILLYCSLAMAGILPLFGSAKIPAWEISINLGFIIAAAILLVCGLALCLLLRSSRPEGVLIMIAISALASSYPLYNMAMPSLDKVMSPKIQGEIIKAHIKDGFYPITFGLYGGTYTYYAGHSLDKISDLNEFSTLSQSKDKIILAIRDKDYTKWENKTEGLKEISRQWIESNEYILLTLEKAAPTLDIDSSSEKSSTERNSTDGDTSYIDDSLKAPTESAPVTNQNDFEAQDTDMGKKPAKETQETQGEYPLPAEQPSRAKEANNLNTILPQTKTDAGEHRPEIKTDNAVNSETPERDKAADSLEESKANSAGTEKTDNNEDGTNTSSEDNTEVSSEDGTNTSSEDNTEVSSEDGTNASSEDNIEVSSEDGTNASSEDNTEVSSKDGTNTSSEDNIEVSSEDGTNASSEDGTNASSEDNIEVSSEDGTNTSSEDNTEVSSENNTETKTDKKTSPSQEAE